MIQDRKKRKIVIGLVLLLLMAVGYAVFDANLNIKRSTNISNSWDVRITKITSKNVVGGASNLEDPSYTNLTATFKTNLVSPGDSIEYDITVTNKGSIDAILDKITITDSNNPARIFTKSGLTEGDTLLAKKSKVLKVKVEYSNSVTSQPENTESSVEVTLNFSQNDGHTVNPTPQTETVNPTPQNETVYSWPTDELKIGDSIEGISTTTDPSTLGKMSFLKHTIKDGKIESSEACFIKDGNTYCLKPNEYETSKAKLLEVFGKSACEVYDFNVLCGDSSVGAVAVLDGPVEADGDLSLCRIFSDGTSRCGVSE